MAKKRTYRSVDIKSLDVPALLAMVNSPVLASIDVAKASFVASISNAGGEVLRIVRFTHPIETREFIDLLVRLKHRAGALTVLMEPTGTYGDAIRYQLAVCGIDVRMVQPKSTHDAKSAFDRVPSQFDQKDAVTMMKLHLGGGSTQWKTLTDARRNIRAMLDGYIVREERAEALFNQIEARLTKHWPEFEQWLSIRKHASARTFLAVFTSPQQIALDPDAARATLRRASYGSLSSQLIDGVVESASSTLGIPMLHEQRDLLRALITTHNEEIAATNVIEKRLHEYVKDDKVIARMRDVIGPMAATAVVSFIGLPADFPGARAFLKAAGLNMRESSSGTQKSNVHITKRGPSFVRHLVYLAALRAVPNDPIARAWYQKRKCYEADERTGALVALMRKLLTAAYHVGKYDVAYDAAKLFDTRRLTYTPVSERAARKAPTRRTGPKSIARKSRSSRRANAGGAQI